MSEPRPPAVTLSLVTWNGGAWLDECLRSVAAQSRDDHEVLVVDNASSDGSVAVLRAYAVRDDRIRLVESPVNLGYGRAHNLNIRAARGEHVLLLNQDIVLDPGFLAAGVAALDAHPEAAAVQGRIRRLGPAGERTDSLDTTGLIMGRDRRATIRSHLQVDDGQTEVSTAGLVWGADGPAPIYRRAALMEARLPRRGGGWEILDEDFFVLKEDVDLAWRMRRLGWKAWYEPSAMAWHARTGIGPRASAAGAIIRANMSNPVPSRSLSWRNQRLMQVKNEDARAFIRDLPWILWREVLELAFITVVDVRRLGAVPGFLRALPWAMRKRRVLSARLREPDVPGAASGSWS